MTTLAHHRTLLKSKNKQGAMLKLRLQYSFLEKGQESLFNECFVKEHLADQLM